MLSINIIIVAAIFFIFLFFMAVFVAQQFSTVEKNRPKNGTKTLSEKLASGGIKPIESDRFREIVERADSFEDITAQPETSEELSFFDIPDDTESQEQDAASVSAGSSPAELDFSADNPILRSLGDKDLQSLYSEYLTQKNISPFDPEPDFKLGLAYLKFRQFDKAQKQFQKVKEMNPEFPDNDYFLGEALRCNGQFYDAMQAYKNSAEKKQQDLSD